MNGIILFALLVPSQPPKKSKKRLCEKLIFKQICQPTPLRGEAVSVSWNPRCPKGERRSNVGPVCGLVGGARFFLLGCRTLRHLIILV